jgi:hypothetical protein
VKKVEKIDIQGRWFITERTTCLHCGRKFTYLLPPEALFYWSRLCSKCDPTAPDRRPKGDEIWIEAMPMRMPWD